MRTARTASIALLLSLAACSGSVQSTDAEGGVNDGAADAGGRGDALSPADAGGGDAHSLPDAGGATCRTTPPTAHRPSASTCPAHVPDAGSDAGMPGCMPPHDACIVDSDCGSSGVCDCQEPRCIYPFPSTGNVCIPSDCHVDSDCACGYCAADVSCGATAAYHCTTPQDECSTDADCNDGGSFMECHWSTDHWACVQGMACPG